MLDSCPTNGLYNEENGQEVFLSDNCNLSDKLPHQKHLALAGIQLQSRILNKYHNNKWKQTAT